MGQELVIPDSFKNTAPAQAFSALDPHTESLSDGIGQSYGVIGYKGKVWSLRYRGERHNFVRPDDGTPSSFIDVVILGQAHAKSKSFYKKFDPNTSDGDRPICSSIDGVVPDADVTTKQADSCQLCPRNVWKTDPTTGRKGRECTDYKRVAVLLLPTQTKALLGDPLIEPVFLRVPPASLNALAIMGDTMANQGFHFSTYITRISFDPDESHPKMVFRPLQGLTDKEAPVILELRNDATVGRITGGDVALPSPVTKAQAEEIRLPAGSGIVEVKPDPTTTGLSSTQAGSTQGGPSTSKASVPPVTTNGAQAALAGASSSAPKAGPEIVDTGFGGVSTAPEPAAQTTADTGEPEESDDDLDARIAGLIKT